MVHYFYEVELGLPIAERMEAKNRHPMALVFGAKNQLWRLWRTQAYDCEKVSACNPGDA